MVTFVAEFSHNLIEVVDAYISGYSVTENNGNSTDYYNKKFKND